MPDRVANVVRSRRKGLALAAGLGLVAATGQAPLGWTWVSLIAFSVAIALQSIPERRVVIAWRGWAFGAGYFAGALFWIVEPFLVDVARHGWMAPFGLVFLAGGLALFWVAAFWLAATLGRGYRTRVAWLVVTLTGAEMLRSVVLTGFPWALIGHIWIGTPQMQAAALAGAHGLTLLTLVAAAMPAFFGANRAVLGGFFAVALASVPAIFGTSRVPGGPVPSVQPPLVVRLVQPNAPQHLKWRPDMVPVFYQRQIDLTAEAPAQGPRPDIVIWPETSVPWLLEYAGEAFAEIAQAANGAQVILGVQRRDDLGRWYNALVLLEPDGAVGAVYDKHHLVPFGEYMPFMEVFARWEIFGLAVNDTGGYAAGPGPALIDLGRAGKALPLICYEAIFPNDIARAPGRADWLVQITNDAWFGRYAGPYQHMALARLRAVEQGLPMMRAANTGVSAAFDPYGRILGQIPLGEAGAIDISLSAPLPPTAYARYGDLPVSGLLVFLASVIAFAGRRRISG